MSSRDWSAAGGLAGLVLVLLVALGLLAAYVFVKAINLCLRVWVRYPSSRRPLLAGLLVFASSLAAAVATLAVPFVLLAVVSFLAVLLVARAIELRNADAFEEPSGLGGLARRVVNLYDWWEEVA